MLGAAASQAVEAEPVDLAGAGWEVLTVPGKEPARFVGGTDGAIEVTAEGAVAFLYKDFLAMGMTGQGLSWRWRVDMTISPTDLSRPGMDDRPLAVHVWFPKAPEELSFWDEVGTLFGVPAIGYALTYVWGGKATRGEYLPNPHLDNAALVVLRDGDASTGVWFEEQVDLAADFQRVFGRPMSELQYVAISADTDDTGATARARVADLRVLPVPADKSE